MSAEPQLADAFSASYGEARAKFCQAAEAVDAELAAHLHPLRGRDGEELALDLAHVGPSDAQRCLVIASATHGGEGFMGSGLQVQLLRELAAGRHGELLGATAERSLALLFVHAHNPHGFSWVRRVNEDNVDLNRNFVDFGGRLPANPRYGELADWLVPADWGGPLRAAAEAALAEWIAVHGQAAFQSAVAGGQYSHPDGLFYGGAGPSWTAKTVERIAATRLGGLERVGLLDLHTGLGPRAHGELIFAGGAAEPEYARLCDWLGSDVTCPSAGTSSSEPVVGTIDRAYRAACRADAFTGVVLEVGTLPLPEVLEAHRRDAWLWKHADPAGPEGAAVRAQMRAAMFGEEPEWQGPVWERFGGIVERFARALRS